MMSRLVLSVSVLCLFGCAFSAPCPTTFAKANANLTAQVTNLNTTCLQTTCMNCVTNPSLLKTPSVTCLSITSPYFGDFSELRNLDKGICVEIDALVTKPIKLGKGNDCITLGSSANVTSIDTGDGSDFVYGNGATVKSLKTGRGGDVVIFAGGNLALLDTGAGDDFVSFIKANVTANKVITASGNDYFLQEFGKVNDLRVGSGDDNVTVFGIVNHVDLSGGDDEIAVGYFKQTTPTSLKSTGYVKDINPGRGTNVIGALANATIQRVNSDSDRRNSFCIF